MLKIRLKEDYIRQKSYADWRQKDLEFQGESKTWKLKKLKP